MAKDPRKRSIKGHVTAQQSLVVDWANQKQQEEFEYGPYPQCASGGFGSGKSFSFCLKALTLSLTFPHNRGVIARREYEQLKHTTMATFYKICPPQLYLENGKRSDSEKYLRLNNGSEILWMHLDDPETENVIRGLEINWFFIDQAEEVEEEIFDLMTTRLGRWDRAEVPEAEIMAVGGLDKWPWRNPANNKALVPTYPMIACNPDTEIHWIYRRFHPDSPEFQERYQKMGYRLWNMSSEENKFLPKQNLDLMLQKDESFVRRFVRGEWGIPEGQIHQIDKLSILSTDAADREHPERGVYVEPESFIDHIRRTCVLHRAMDHGDAAPTCCLWWAVDQSGNVFFFREYYRPNLLISEHRQNITAYSEGEQYRFNIADPSIFHKTMQKYGGRWSVSDEYSDKKNQNPRTALNWAPGDNDEFGTRNRINEYLRVDPDRIHPVTKTRGSPRIFFVKFSHAYPQGCRKVLTELRAQRRVKLGTDMGRPIFSDERDPKIPDHGYDPVRYAVAAHAPNARAAEQRLNPNSFDAIARETQRWVKRGGPLTLARDQKRRFRMLTGAA